MSKYSHLGRDDSYSVFIDENERKESLGKPRYALCDVIALGFVVLIWIISLPITWCFSFKIIPQYERVIIFRLGRLLSLKGPGLIFVIPCIDSWKRVDMRMKAFNVAPQEIVTIDRGILKVGGDVQYRINDPLAAHTLIQDINHSLRVTAHAALNTILSQEKIKYILSEKYYLETHLQAYMHKVVSEWGIEVARFELTHSTVMRDAGNADPNVGESDEMGGHAAIVNLLKSFTSPASSTAQMPGLLPQNFNPFQNMMSQSANQMTPKTETTNQITPLTPEELFCVVKGVLNEALCEKIGAIYEFHITSNDCTKIWTIDLKNSPGMVLNNGNATGVDVRFKLSEETFRNIFYGTTSPTEAYMNGSLEIDGSLEKATRLEHLVRKMKGQ